MLETKAVLAEDNNNQVETWNSVAVCARTSVHHVRKFLTEGDRDHWKGVVDPAVFFTRGRRWRRDHHYVQRG